MPSGWKRITRYPMAENRRTITCVSALDVLLLARRAWERSQPQLFLDLESSAPGGTSVPADNPSRVGPDTGGIQRAGAETPAATTGTDRPPNSGLSTPPAPPEPLPPAGGEPQTLTTTRASSRKVASRRRETTPEGV